MCATREMRARF